MKIKSLGANKTELTFGSTVIFFSYSTPVACLKDGKYYRTDKKHSVTTSRHINEWLDGMPVTVMPQDYFDNLQRHYCVTY